VARLLRTVLWRLLGSALALTIFVASAVVGALLHINAPAARGLAEHLAARWLSETFRGTVTVEGIERLSAQGLSVRRLGLVDAQGRTVLVLHDVSGAVDLGTFLPVLVGNAPRVTLLVPHVRAKRAEVLIAPDPDTNEPSIARALEPVQSAAREQAQATQEVRVWLPEIEVGSATGSVDIPDVPPFHARVVGVHGQVLVTPAGVAVDVRRFGANLRRRDGTEARGTATLSVRAPGPIRGSFEGFYGDVEVQARVQLRRERIEAVVSLPGASPQAMDAILPGWPLQERVAGRVEVRGILPNLEVDASLSAGPSTIQARGTAFVEQPLRAKLSVTGEHLDLRLLIPDAPETDLDLSGDFHFDDQDGALRLQIGAKTEPTTVAGQSIPAAEIEGTLQDGSFRGRGRLLEPGLPLDVDVDVSREGIVELDVRARAFDLRKIRRVDLGFLAHGSGRVTARIEKGRIDARYTLTLRDASTKEVRLGLLEVTGTARASLDDIERANVTGTASARNASFGVFTAETLKGSFSGRWPNGRFEVRAEAADQRTLQASGRVSLHGQAAVEDLTLALSDRHVQIQGKIARFVPETGALDVDHFVVDGVGGTVHGFLRLRKDLLETQVQGENIDVARIAAALGLPHSDLQGRMRLNVDLVAGRDVTRGRMSLRLGNATFGPVSGVSLDLRAHLDGRRLTAETSGLLHGVGTFGGSCEADLAGFLLDAETWRDATGKAELTLSELNLPLLAVLLGPDAAISPVGGRGYLQVGLERRRAGDLPNVLFTATTRGLELAVADRAERPAVHLPQITLHTTGALNGRTGDASGTLLIADDRGELLTTSGAMKIDLEAVTTAPAQLGAHLLSAPIDLLVRVPPRSFEHLPPPLRLEALTGTLQATLQVKGHLARPTFHMLAFARNVRGATDRSGLPADVDVEAQYDPIAATATGGLRASVAGRTVARAEARARRSRELWVGRSKVELDGLPLTAIPGLSQSDLHGLLSGKATLERSEQTHGLDADITLRQGAIGRSPVEQARLLVRTTPRAAELDLQIVKPTGRLSAEASIPIDWGSAIPELRRGQPVSGRVRAVRFDAAAVAPLMADVFDRLGGLVDGDVAFRLAPPTEPGTGWQGTLDGGLELKHGHALIKALGMEVRNVRLQTRLTREAGRTRVSISDVRGQVRSSTDNLIGEASLVLKGLELVSGTARLRVDDFPLLLEGVSQGLASGTATARLTRKPEHMLVEVQIPEMLTKLPRSSSRRVIDLNEHPDVYAFQLTPDTAEPGGEVFPWQILVRFGDRVRIRQSDIDIGIRGAPIIELAERTHVFGTVELAPGGRVPVLGKVFVIESGFVHFDTGDSSNPRLDITATWRSPNDTMVYVDVTGTLKDSQIVLRSDPPLPEPEVFALLIGGPSTDRSDTTPSTGGSAAGAVGLGSGVAALGVSELLLGESPVSLSVGTTSESRPRYTAAVRIGQDLWFEASTYERAAIGAHNDARSVFSGTIDYRFTRNWSLRTEVGTAGGVMDLLWQYRY
jgi:hypothetical protein